MCIKRSKLHRDSENFIQYRENIEWLNFWWDNANSKNQDGRILLIGDSLLRSCRKQVSDIIKKPVDFIGLSGMVNDEMLLREIELFFSFNEYKYRFIYIQLGCHGCIQENGIVLDDQFYLDYALQYEYVIEYLMNKCNKLILGTTTQIVELKKYKNPIINFFYIHFHCAKKENIDIRYEEEIIRRNSIVRDVSVKYNLSFNDMYKYMLNEGNDIRHIDHVHYQRKAQMFIAQRICNYLIGE